MYTNILCCWIQHIYKHACTHAHSCPGKRSHFRNINIRWDFGCLHFWPWTFFSLDGQKGEIECNIANWMYICMYILSWWGPIAYYLCLFGLHLCFYNIAAIFGMMAIHTIRLWRCMLSFKGNVFVAEQRRTQREKWHEIRLVAFAFSFWT